MQWWLRVEAGELDKNKIIKKLNRECEGMGLYPADVKSLNNFKKRNI